MLTRRRAPYTGHNGNNGDEYASNRLSSESGYGASRMQPRRQKIPPEPVRRTASSRRTRTPPLAGQGVLAPIECSPSGGNKGGTAGSNSSPSLDVRGRAFFVCVRVRGTLTRACGAALSLRGERATVEGEDQL